MSSIYFEGICQQTADRQYGKSIVVSNMVKSTEDQSRSC